MNKRPDARDLIIVAGTIDRARWLRNTYLDMVNPFRIPWRRIQIMDARRPSALHGVSNAVVWVHVKSVYGGMPDGSLQRFVQALQPLACNPSHGVKVVNL